MIRMKQCVIELKINMILCKLKKLFNFIFNFYENSYDIIIGDNVLLWTFFCV